MFGKKVPTGPIHAEQAIKKRKTYGTTEESPDQTEEVLVQCWTTFKRQAPPNMDEGIGKKVEPLSPTRCSPLPYVERDIDDFDCHHGG